MSSPADTIARLRRELDNVQQTLGAQFHALRGELDRLETELKQKPAPEPPPLPPLVPAPVPGSDLVEVADTVTSAEAELLQEAPPLSPAEDSRLIETSLPPSAIPIDLTREAPPTPPRSPSEAEILFGQKWPLIAGVFLVLFGLGYFLKYSFEQNWIGPIGRVCLAYLTSGALLAVGEIFRRRQLAQFGLYLIGGGLAALYLSTFAAYSLYQLLPVLGAFALMILITILAGTLAVFYNVMGLAVLGLIGGFATPLILSTGAANQIGLMSYMTVLNAGILGLALCKRWNLLNYLGFVFTWSLFSGWFFRDYSLAAFTPTLFFLNLFFLIYALAPFLYYFVRERRGDLTGFAISLPNAFIAFGYSYYLIREKFGLPYVGLVSVAYATLYLALAQHLYRRNPEFVGAFVFLLAKAILFLVITVPVLFSQQWITIFWAVQAAVVLWAGTRLKNDWLQTGGVILLLLTLGKFLFYDYPTAFAWNMGNLAFDNSYLATAPTRWLTTLILLGALAYIAKLSREMFWVVLGVGLLLLVFSTETSGFFYVYHPLARSPALVVLWALAAGLMLGLERSRFQHELLLWAGGVLLIIALAKFWLYDYSFSFQFELLPLSFSPSYFFNAVTRWITTAAVLGAVFAAATFRQSRTGFVAGTIFLFLILNAETGGFFQEVAPRAKLASISVLWALFAIVLLILGFSKRTLWLRRSALGLFGVTLLKVFLMDMANASTPFRIISFIVLGLILIGASFLYHRYRDLLSPPDPEPPASP